jgi:hypothetical protein
MKLSFFLLLLIASLSVLGQFSKTLLRLANVPNIIPLIRDGVTFGLAFYGLSRINLFESKRIIWGIFLMIVVFYIYGITAFFQDQHFAGLYYIRLYALPVLFLLSVYGVIGSMDSKAITHSVRIVLLFNILLVIFAIVLYVLIQNDMSYARSLIGEGGIPTAWYISGGTLMRMGLPATGPNSLGLVVGLNILLITHLILSRSSDVYSKFKLGIMLVISFIALIMTFSRSSWLMVMVGVIGLFALNKNRVNNKSASGLLVALSFSVIAGLAGLIVLDSFNNGFVMRWVELNTNMTDPSMQGHFRTLQEAWFNLPEYILNGYPRGTVGPKAIFFSLDVNLVENSVIGILYDMGLPLAILFFLAYSLLLSKIAPHRTQAILIIAFFVCSQFLPYFFEPDALIYFFFVLVLLGGLDFALLNKKEYEYEKTNSPATQRQL